VSELAQMLTSANDVQRIYALQRVTELAYHAPDVNLTAAIPALVGMYNKDPDKRYRLAAVSALHAIGDEHGMQQVRKRVLHEPSLSVQYAAVGALLHHYGPQAFGSDAKTVALARNIIARKEEAGHLSQTQQAAPVVAEKN
jgi:HEAT repeat protein